jgi:succinoglycan biosynthesis protein ExoA
MSSPHQHILVVIPTLNEASTIEMVLRDLSVDLPKEPTIEFVVVDGGSTDGTCDIVRRFSREHGSLHLLHNPKRLQGAGVNLAVQRFGEPAQILIRCDAHGRYPPGFIRRLLETQIRTGAESVVIPMDSIGTSCFQKAVAWVSNMPVGTGGALHRGEYRSGFVDHGHHAAFRMSVFLKVGGYDESFTHNEDAEFDWRLGANGGRIYLDAANRFAHFPRADVAGLWRQYFNYGRGRSRTARRHPASIRMRQMTLPVHFALCGACLLFAPWLPVLLLWPALYLGVLAATSLGLAARHASLCGLLAGLAALIMHSAWAAGFLYGVAAGHEPRWRGEEASDGIEAPDRASGPFEPESAQDVLQD